jgi:hypothetical protein
MPPRRPSPKARARSPHRSGSGADPTAILLEDVRGQMRVVIESLQGCASKTDLAAHDAKLEVMSTALEDVSQVVRTTRADLAAVVTRLDATNTRLDATDAGLMALRTDVSVGFCAMNQRFDTLIAEVSRKADRSALTALEQRVSVLEHRDRPHSEEPGATR